MISRSSTLDVLRGMAALAVTVFHLNEPVAGVDNWYRAAVKYGWLGVAVFFVLSGYLIHGAARQSSTMGAFLWRRLTRIYPPYWASLLIVGAAVGVRFLVVGVNDRTVLPRDVGGVLATLTAMVSPATTTAGLNWVYWTLAYELVFYAITALAVRWPRVFVWVAVVLSVASAMPGSWFGIAEGQYLQWSINGFAQLPGLFFLSHWPLFGLGVAISLAAERRFTAALVVGGACGIATVVRFPLEVVLTAVVTMGAVVAAIRGWELPRLIQEPLTRLGTISYSLYLIHVPIGCWLLLEWKDGGWLTVPWQNATYDAGVSGVCVVAAVGFYKLVEAPSLRLGRLWIGAKKKPPATAETESSTESVSRPGRTTESVITLEESRKCVSS